jgi:carbon monoxide dehydrogenase subunit G
MGFNKPAAGRSTSRQDRKSRTLLDRFARRSRRGLHLEPLEERRLLDASAHNLASGDFSQNWTDPTLILASDDWSRVPSIIGYAGASLSTSGADPQTILADQTTVTVKQDPSLTNSFQIIGDFDTLGTIALQGSSNASNAPFLRLHLNTTGRSSVNVSYTLRDIDPSVDDAVQQFALQYRIGSTGNFINVPGGYVADATTANSATKVSSVSATLPAAVNNQPLVQVRIITADAVGNDEWVGVDDIVVSSSPLVTLPSVSIGDESVTETNSDNLITLPLILSSVATSDVVINYETVDGAAQAGSDYQAVTRSAMIPTGSISTTISLIVSGDTVEEPNESFFVNITGASGATIADNSGQVTILNDDVTPVTTTTVALDASGNLVLLDSDSPSDDSLTIQADTVNSRYIISDPNNALQTGIAGATGGGSNTLFVPFSAVTGPQILVNTLSGNDIVTLDYSLGAFGKALVFDGGASGNDGIRVVGSGMQSAVYQPSSTAAGSGQITVGGDSVSFSNLEPMDFTGMASFTLLLPGAADVVNVDNSFDFATGTIPALRLSGISGAVPFEAAHVFGNTTVVIDTALVADGADLVLVNSANNAHNNANLTINTGAGADSVLINGAVTLAGNLSITSQQINVLAPIRTDLTANAGSVSLIGSSMVTVAGSIDTDSTTADNNVLITGSSVTLSQPVAAGAGTVRLLSNGNLSQTAAGVITAAALGVRNNAAAGQVSLAQANDVDTFAAFNAAGGANAIAFADTDGVTIGSVAAQGAFAVTKASAWQRRATFCCRRRARWPPMLPFRAAVAWWRSFLAATSLKPPPGRSPLGRWPCATIMRRPATLRSAKSTM